ncbi:hypothetical protein [Catenovulum maritimum]|uniref:hypothetical protein n=1 Tax=Catenovulum maritimum TaxID=1513271 RepID=UPI0006609B48|nr:hypothetical protein [Catenovulum maritimum]
MRKLLLIISFVCLSTSALACDKQVTVPLLESSKDRLILDLLKLSLSKTSIQYCINEYNQVLTEGRKASHVKKGILSLQWASTGSQSSQLLQAVKHPIFRGLTGFRLLVIREGEQSTFDQIKDLTGLKGLTAGQGQFWGDTQVLRANNLPVVTSTQARKLWKMLHLKRFDYLPLGLHEPWKDLKMRPSYHLSVEKNWILSYPAALYFYTQDQESELHKNLTQGMQAALDDGSYQNMLISSDMFQSIIKQASVEKRRVIELNNPYNQNTELQSIAKNFLNQYLSSRTVQN